MAKKQHHVKGRHHRRHHNPGGASVPQIRVLHPMSYLPYVGTGIAGAFVSAAAPKFTIGLSATPAAAYVTQFVVGIGGALAIGRFLSPAHGFSWLIGAGVGSPLGDLFRRWFAGVAGAGMAMYPYGGSPGGYLGAGADKYYAVSPASYYPTGRAGLAHYGRPGYIGPTPGIGGGIGAYRLAYS